MYNNNNNRTCFTQTAADALEVDAGVDEYTSSDTSKAEIFSSFKVKVDVMQRQMCVTLQKVFFVVVAGKDAKSCCKMCDAFPVSCCRHLQVKDPLASAGGVASSLGRIGKTKAPRFFSCLKGAVIHNQIRSKIVNVPALNRESRRCSLKAAVTRPTRCCVKATARVVQRATRHRGPFKHSSPPRRRKAARGSKGINPSESDTAVLACDTAALPLVTVGVDKDAAIDLLSGEIAASLAMRRLLICVSAAAAAAAGSQRAS